MVRLADPLTAEALIARGRPGRREEVQRAMVGVYEQVEELDDRDALRLAVWKVELGLAIDVVDAVRAADLALARSDPATAERLAAAAMAGGGGPGAAIRRGEALRQLQRHAAAEATLAPVGDHLAELDDDLRFRFAAARALALGTEMGRLDEAVAVLEAVIAVMDARPPRWRLEAHLSFLLADCGRIRAAAPLAEARLDRPEEDEPAALIALVAGGIVRTLGGRCQDTLELCEAMTPMALRHLDDVPEAIGWVAAAQMFATYVRGELHDADALAATLEQLVVDHPDPSLRAAVLMYRGLVLSDQGRLDAALRVLRQAAALHEVDNHRGYQAWVLAIMARTHAQRGDLDAARVALAAARRHRWPDGQVFDTDIEVAAVWVEALGGDRGRAEEVLAGALRGPRPRTPRRSSCGCVTRRCGRASRPVPTSAPSPGRGPASRACGSRCTPTTSPAWWPMTASPWSPSAAATPTSASTSRRPRPSPRAPRPTAAPARPPSPPGPGSCRWPNRPSARAQPRRRCGPAGRWAG